MNYYDQYRVKPDSKVDLSQWDPGDTRDLKDKKGAKEAVEKNAKRLAELQYLLYAENKRSLLVILQAMDAGGKDGTIRHVMGMLNPQGCRVSSFKAPNEVEASHDFLWRIHHNVPKRGEIGIFNRSHYEDVLIVRVHDLVEKEVWSKRYDQINDFEKTLTESGVPSIEILSAYQSGRAVEAVSGSGGSAGETLETVAGRFSGASILEGLHESIRGGAGKMFDKTRTVVYCAGE